MILVDTSILADTSVWVDHFRHGNARLRELLEQGNVATHPLVLGELACGALARRSETLSLLRRLPGVSPAADDAVHHLIEARRLWGKGIGWIDAHLLAASLISGFALWTLDRRLASIAASVRAGQ